MQDTIQTRLEREGITLPAPAAPAANYLPFVQTGNLIFTAGQHRFDPPGETAPGNDWVLVLDDARTPRAGQ